MAPSVQANTNSSPQADETDAQWRLAESLCAFAGKPGTVANVPLFWDTCFEAELDGRQLMVSVRDVTDDGAGDAEASNDDWDQLPRRLVECAFAVVAICLTLGMVCLFVPGAWEIGMVRVGLFFVGLLWTLIGIVGDPGKANRVMGISGATLVLASLLWQAVISR